MLMMKRESQEKLTVVFVRFVTSYSISMKSLRENGKRLVDLTSKVFPFRIIAIRL